ncbi:MAG: UbiA family prenyltransferase [Patescibacteria group bacterium]
MTTTVWLYKVTRPVQIIAAASSTWVAALLSNGPDPFSSNKVAAAAAMGLGVLAASIFHYGAANRMYARKVWDLVEVENPAGFVAIGIVIFTASCAIAVIYLPWECSAIAIADAIIVVLYARILSKRWVTKNTVIAFVCTTPILMGWWAGHRLHPIVPYAIVIAFSAYLAREIVKDIQDIRANEGIRVTLPIQLGIIGAMRIAGIFAAVSAVVTASLFGVFHPSVATGLLIIFAIAEFTLVAHHLFVHQEPARIHQDITRGIYALILSVVVLTLPL